MRFTLALLFAILLAVPAYADDPTGIWLNDAGSLRIRISPCGAAFCGTTVWLRDPQNDDYNPDPAKRSVPLLGLRLLSGMAPSGTADEWKGTAYSPEDGRTYAESMVLRGNKLQTQGCVTGSAICHSAVWSRVKLNFLRLR